MILYLFKKGLKHPIEESWSHERPSFPLLEFPASSGEAMIFWKASIQVSSSKETGLKKLHIGGRGRVIDVRWIQKGWGSSYNPEMVRVYKQGMKAGDKVEGRHENKGWRRETRFFFQGLSMFCCVFLVIVRKWGDKLRLFN